MSRNQDKFELKPSEPTEAEIQRSILDYLRVDYRVAWAARFNVGAMELEYRDKKGNFSKHFVKFGFPGLSDIIGQMKTGHFLAIECKSRKGRLTDDQRRFLDMVISNNGIGIVARSVADVVEGLRERP